jgi:hypothetical protein
MRLPSRLEDERKSCVIPCLLFRQSPNLTFGVHDLALEVTMNIAANSEGKRLEYISI